jgi:hypothetical protein
MSPESLRSSFGRTIPRGYQLIPIQSDTNSTMTGIPGPGRIVGSILSSAGRRLERAIDRFAEEQLGLGPHQAALRLTLALHDLHVKASPECRSDHIAELNVSEHATDRLIWICNGICSHCHLPYLPMILMELPDPVMKAVLQLIKYLQWVPSIYNRHVQRVKQLQSHAANIEYRIFMPLYPSFGPVKCAGSLCVSKAGSAGYNEKNTRLTIAFVFFSRLLAG